MAGVAPAKFAISLLGGESAGGLGSRTVDLALATMTINILSLALPVMTLQIYDRIVVHAGIGTLRMLVVGVCAAVVLDAVLRLARAYLTSWSSATFEHRMTCRAVRNVVDADFATLQKNSASDLLQRVSAIGRLREFIGGQAFVSLIDLPFVTIFLGLIWYLAGSLVFVPLALLGLFLLLAMAIGSALRAALARREQIGDRRTDFIIEALSGIHTIKSMGLEAAFARRHERVQADLTAGNYLVAMIGSGVAMLGALFSQITLVTVTGFGAPMVIDGQLTVGTLVACVMLSGRIVQPLQRALGIWTRLQDVQLAQERAGALFSLPRRDVFERPHEPDRVGQLALTNVSFQYSDVGPTVLQGIGLSLEPGESISISGSASSGKTTLLQLISGLLSPSEGSVLIDGADATQYPTDALARYVGYIPSHGTAYQGTILENLTGFGSVSESQALEVARLLGLDTDIAKLPRGYDTPVTDGAAELIPPSLLQLIAIARILAHKPRILLFDNADSGLDKVGYNRVFHLLGRLKGKVTMVIISDDRNFLRLAAEEYVLDQGRLVRRGYANDSKIYGVTYYQELQL